MLFNKTGQVFAGNRIDQSVEAWQMPQGGIDEGETPRQACMRELMEELGTDKAEILREHPGWLTYDLPEHLVGVAWEGKYRGQRLKWFALRFLGENGDIDIATAHPEFSNWKWVEIGDLVRLAVPFKRESYTQVIAAFGDLARPGR